MRIKLLLFCVLHIFVFTCSFAQTNRYVVYFTDKAGATYSIEKPEEYLSERAILRRKKQNISITQDDFPVNPWYIDSLTLKGADVFYTSRWFNAALVQTTPEIIDEINKISIVQKVDFAAPGEKLSMRREALNESQEFINSDHLEFHNVVAMHNDGFTGKDIWIAVMDGGFSGVNTTEAFTHLYQDNKIAMAYNFVNANSNVYQYSDHGTSVLSLICAQHPDFVGIAYDAHVGLFITEDVFSENRIEEYNWLFAAEKADSAGFDIINTSLGYFSFDDPDMDYNYADMNGTTTVITRASNFASERGILTVTSAGNEGNGSWKYIAAPADAFESIAVAAVNISMQRSGFSSIGPTADGRLKPELAALGSGVKVINSAGNVVSKNGTSFSAPIVTGIAAGVWERFPDLSMSGLREQLLVWSRHPHGMVTPDIYTGNGILKYENPGGYIITKTKNVIGKIEFYPNPARELITFSNLPADATVVMHDTMGRKQRIDLNGNELKVPHLKQGVYIISIQTSGRLFNYRLVKE